MAKISGIYVEIRGDSTQLRKDLATARQHVTEQATGMSNALNNALSPAQLKNNINGIVRNLNTLSQASKLTGKEFGAIGADLKDLQRLTGLSEKAFRDLQSRMIQTSAAKAQETALRNVAKAADLSAKEVAQLGKQMGVSAAGIAAVNGASRSASSSLSMLGTAAQAALAYFSVQTVIEFSRAVLDAGIAMDSLQRSFVAVTGSQAGAAETLSFLREEAGRLGQNFYALAPEFKNVMAAARGTAMEGENVRKMFSAIAGASTALGLSADDTHGTLRALQQMMSKGKIQAEELRGQLGERLPGALNLMAKAMGVSTAELNKMMEDGKLLSDEALPKLTAEIERVYGAAAETAALESAQAAVNRLSQAWTDFKVNLFDNEQAVAGINAITSAIKTLTEYAGLRSVSDTFAQGAGLADKGLIDFDVFRAAGYIERQRMVDEFIDSQKVAAKSFTATWATAEQQNLESFERYNERRQELEASATKKREEAAKKANEELRKLTQTDMEKLAERRDKLIADGADRVATEKWYADEVAKLNEKSTKKFADEQKKQLEAHKKAREAMRKNEAETLSAIDKWMEDYEQQQIEAVASGVAERKKLREDEAKAAADAARKIAEEQEASAQKVMDRIQEGTADVFYDMFQDIGKGWETLWDSMKSWALRTLAELAARAATVNIVVPIMTSMTGTANATQAVQAITGGQGGGFNLSSLSSLVQPGSMLSKVPGMSAVTGLLGATLPGTATALTGAFSGVGAGAGMYATGLGFAPGAVANGALQGMTLGGQSLATAAPAMTSGLTLGSALGFGAMGGLGYSLLGGSLGLPQNQYSGITSSLGGALGAWGGSALAGTAGAALGATAGSVVPIIGTAVGAILGGLGSSLFGEKEHSPSVLISANQTAWGDANVNAHGKSGAGKSGVIAVEEMLEQYMAGQFSAVEAALGSMGSKYIDMLQGQTFEFGRNTAGNNFAWDWGSDKDAEKVTAQAQEILRRKIYEAAAGAFTAAGQDIASGDGATEALSMLSEKAAGQFSELQAVIAAGVQSGNVEAYIAHLQNFQSTIQAIVQTWDSINAAADDLVKPPTAYESAVRQANASFDEWVGTLSALGFASAQIEEIEDKRAATLARLNAEMGPLAEAEAARASALAEAEAARASALADATRAVETAQGNLRAAYRREAAEIEATAKKWDSFAESLKKWRDDIMTGSMSPIPASSQADMAASRYADVLNRAKLGDEDAIAELQGVAGQQLTVAKDTAKTAEDYARSALRTLGEVRSVESVATRHADIARQQLEALTSQVEALITINESVLSVVDAINALEMAQATQATQATQVDAQKAVPSGGFDPEAYLANKTASLNTPGAKQPDFYTPSSGTWTAFDTMSAIAMAGMTLEEHYLKYGIKEGIKGYASGGMHSGGLRLVGENGPELEVTGPARIWNAEDTRNLLSGGGDGTASEVRALRDDLRAIGRALAKNTADTAKLMQRWDGDGMPEVRVA